jgi:hypothetical protein
MGGVKQNSDWMSIIKKALEFSQLFYDVFLQKRLFILLMLTMAV